MPSRRLFDRSLFAGAIAGSVLSAAGAGAAPPAPPPDVGSPLLVRAGTGTSVDEMAPGIRRAYIVAIQEELVAHGYRAGAADGVVGRKTRAAIRRYQRDAGLPIDGKATKELLDHLKFALPKVHASGTPAPAPAASSQLVLDIQTELQRRGYYQGRLDGLTGPRTRGAIEQFQRDAGLVVTGNVGIGFLNALRAADPGIRRF